MSSRQGPGPADGAIVVLTGPPGSGKTTTALALASTSKRPAVHLHADDFWDRILSGRIDPWLPQSHDQNETVIDALAAAAAAYARGGFLVVVDGIVGPWFLGRFRALGLPLSYVVLRAPLATALARIAAREAAGPDAVKGDRDDIAGLHRQFADLGALERCVVDVAGLTPEQTLVAVKAVLASGKGRVRFEKDA